MGVEVLGTQGLFSHPVPEQLAVEYSLLGSEWLLTELLSRIPGDQLWKCGRSEAELVKQQLLGIEQQLHKPLISDSEARILRRCFPASSVDCAPSSFFCHLPAFS